MKSPDPLSVCFLLDNSGNSPLSSHLHASFVSSRVDLADRLLNPANVSSLSLALLVLQIRSVLSHLCYLTMCLLSPRCTRCRAALAISQDIRCLHLKHHKNGPEEHNYSKTAHGRTNLKHFDHSAHTNPISSRLQPMATCCKLEKIFVDRSTNSVTQSQRVSRATWKCDKGQ